LTYRDRCLPFRAVTPLHATGIEIDKGQLPHPIGGGVGLGSTRPYFRVGSKEVTNVVAATAYPVSSQELRLCLAGGGLWICSDGSVDLTGRGQAPYQGRPQRLRPQPWEKDKRCTVGGYQ
jgi:hypothetical protein